MDKIVFPDAAYFNLHAAFGLLPVGSLSALLLSHQARKLQKIFDSKQRSPRRDLNKDVESRGARPCGGHPLQLALVVVVDPVLTPRPTLIDQLKLSTE
jgi:hypothetical protein